MEGLDGGGEDSWRVIKPIRRRRKRSDMQSCANIVN
jgi:hypothetical protein